jgi:carbamoyl-phosphate synthase small subunit
MGIPAVADLDTRALARHLRDHGTQRGILRAFPADAVPDTAALVAEARAVRPVGELDVVAQVSLPSGASRVWAKATAGAADGARPRVVVIDTGYKTNIARCLYERGLDVVLASHDVSLAALLALRPDGVLLANGPGDPEAVVGLVRLVRELISHHDVPVMGICLGHQLLGLAIGASTSRLPFGHHGANHPVIERRTGRVTITAQNHNFQVDEATIPVESGFRVSHANLSDGSVEGLEHATRPIFSVQYHPEACPGPHDDRRLFDRFAAQVADYVRERADADAVLVG